MRTDGVLFDLDGTLWNATAAIAEAWRMTVENAPDVKRPPTVEELEGVMGMTAVQLTDTLFPYLDRPRAAELFEECCRAENEYLRLHGGVLYPGMEELLQKLSEKVPLAIVSNCNPEYIPCFLEAHGLERYFTDWECIGRTGLQKWENILLVAERNRLESPVYVGDTSMDREAAEKAGVPFIHASYGFGKISGVEAIRQPSELLDLLFPGEAR